MVLRHAFRKLGLHRIEANVQPENARSLALVQAHRITHISAGGWRPLWAQARSHGFQPVVRRPDFVFEPLQGHRRLLARVPAFGYPQFEP